MSIIKQLKEKQVDVSENILNEEIKKSCVHFVNPYNYLFLRKKPHLISNITAVCYDGVLMQTLANIFISNGEYIPRQSFDTTSLAPKVFQFSIEKEKKVYIAGGNEAEINVFIKKIKSLYPKLDIVGYCNGYLSKSTIIQNILKTEADLVILGLGNIKQEQVACKLFEQKPALYFTCGAYITQTANSSGLDYYPSWVDKYNLRWFYRFLKEKRIIWRVIRYYPIFLITFLWDFLNFEIQEKYFEE